MTIDGKTANKILDIRVQPGGKAAASDFRVLLKHGVLEYGGDPDHMFSRLDIRDIVKDESDAEKWLQPFIDDDC